MTMKCTIPTVHFTPPQPTISRKTFSLPRLVYLLHLVTLLVLVLPIASLLHLTTPPAFFFEFDGNLICIWYFLIPSGGQSVHESTAPRMIKVDCTWDDRSHLASFRVSVPPKLAMVVLIDIDINAYHQGGTHQYLTWA